jgi:tetratricopeptide (TPR) repeat protein
VLSSVKEIFDGVPLAQLEQLLENLQTRIDAAERPEQKARLYNLAGDMCFDARQLERSLGYYDRAITTYTSCQQYMIAGRLCEKILAISPESVRPYYTLASLALMRGRHGEACRWIEKYVSAAETQGLYRMARQFLESLSEVTEESDVLATVADGLKQLNDPERAARVRERMPA